MVILLRLLFINNIISNDISFTHTNICQVGEYFGLSGMVVHIVSGFLYFLFLVAYAIIFFFAIFLEYAIWQLVLALSHLFHHLFIGVTHFDLVHIFIFVFFGRKKMRIVSEILQISRNRGRIINAVSEKNRYITETYQPDGWYTWLVICVLNLKLIFLVITVTHFFQCKSTKFKIC